MRKELRDIERERAKCEYICVKIDATLSELSKKLAKES